VTRDAMSLVDAKALSHLGRADGRRSSDALGVALDRVDHRLVGHPEGEARVRLGRADIVDARLDEAEGAERGGEHRRKRGQDDELDELRALHARANAAAGNSSQSSPMFAVTEAVCGAEVC